MMRRPEASKAGGVIFHKIDRGARNLEDWNDIQELIEGGVDVRFAHESLDMPTRGGRLTVIASDYVRTFVRERRCGTQSPAAKAHQTAARYIVAQLGPSVPGLAGA